MSDLILPQKAVCANCGTEYDIDDLDPIEDEGQRVSPGEESPAGQCPDEECGALCHLKLRKNPITTHELFNHMLGTLETLLGGLHEQEDIGSLLNYINIQVRAVVQQAGGKVPESCDVTPHLKKVAAVDQLVEALKGVMEYYAAYNPITDKRVEPYIREVKAALKNAGVVS